MNRLFRVLLLAAMLASALVVGACGQGGTLSLPDLLARAQQYSGQAVTVSGFYVGRGGNPPLAVLTPVVSTLDNGLDAQPAGDAVWLEGFPEATLSALHQPGDAIYGLVQVSGQFDSAGGYGPEGKYQYQIHVTSAESIERVRRVEQRVSDAALGDGKVGLLELMAGPAKYNGQSITTQGYYFWNGIIYVLAEGISTEEDGTSPQPIGKQIWMEGFPPDESGKLTLGPGNPPSYVWGLVEVTGDFKSGGNFGRDGKYGEFLQVTAAKALEDTNK
jgi:predicted small lipoprotein YifL